MRRNSGEGKKRGGEGWNICCLVGPRLTHGGESRQTPPRPLAFRSFLPSSFFVLVILFARIAKTRVTPRAPFLPRDKVFSLSFARGGGRRRRRAGGEFSRSPPSHSEFGRGIWRRKREKLKGEKEGEKEACSVFLMLVTRDFIGLASPSLFEGRRAPH